MNECCSSVGGCGRRKAKENNFKPVLESIREMMNEDVIIPTWLRDIFLGQCAGEGKWL